MTEEITSRSASRIVDGTRRGAVVGFLAAAAATAASGAAPEGSKEAAGLAAAAMTGSVLTAIGKAAREAEHRAESNPGSVRSIAGRIVGALFGWLVVIPLCILVSVEAHAACPAAFTGAQYDATAGTVKWCAPDVNAAGVAHKAGELARCDFTFTWTGSAPLTISEPSPLPGTVYAFNVGAATGLGSVNGKCFNSYGVAGAEVGVVPTRFPVGTPGAPRLVP